MFYHFECPVCEFDDKEGRQWASEEEIYCGMCTADSGRDVLLKRWPVENDVTTEVDTDAAGQ